MRPLPLLPAASSPRRKAAPLPHVPTQRLRAMGTAALPAALHKTATGASTHTASCPEHLRGTAGRLQGGTGTLCGPTGISASAHAACNTQPGWLAGLRRTVAGEQKGLAAEGEPLGHAFSCNGTAITREASLLQRQHRPATHRIAVAAYTCHSSVTAYQSALTVTLRAQTGNGRSCVRRH